MSESKKRGINKRFLKELFNSFGFLEFNRKLACDVWNKTRNQTGYEMDDSYRDLSRAKDEMVLFCEKKGRLNIYRFNPCSNQLESILKANLNRKLRKRHEFTRFG
jgi:hypothetical protein